MQMKNRNKGMCFTAVKQSLCEHEQSGSEYVDAFFVLLSTGY